MAGPRIFKKFQRRNITNLETGRRVKTTLSPYEERIRSELDRHAAEKTLQSLGIHPDVLSHIDRDKDRLLAAKLAFIKIALSDAEPGTKNGLSSSALHQWGQEHELVGTAKGHFTATWIRPLIELDFVKKTGNVLSLNHEVLQSSDYLRPVGER